MRPSPQGKNKRYIDRLDCTNNNCLPANKYEMYNVGSLIFKSAFSLATTYYIKYLSVSGHAIGTVQPLN